MFKKIDQKKFTKRALSAAVLAPFALALIWYGGLPFLFFIVACAAMALYEWSQLALKTNRKIIILISGALYITASFWCCYVLRIDYSAQIALLFIGMIWMSDIAAYLFGQIIGGPKMASHISPNKTWAGLSGAIIGPALLCLLFLIFGPAFSSPVSLSATEIIMALCVGLAVGIIGQAGDLTISALKRQAGAKDSGDLIPGHGGLLDRIDAMMLAAPVFLLIVSRFPDVFTG